MGSVDVGSTTIVGGDGEDVEKVGNRVDVVGEMISAAGVDVEGVKTGFGIVGRSKRG